MQKQTDQPQQTTQQKTAAQKTALAATLSAAAVAVLAAVYLVSHMTVLALDDSSSQTDIVTLVVPTFNAVLATLGGMLLIVGALFGQVSQNQALDHKI